MSASTLKESDRAAIWYVETSNSVVRIKKTGSDNCKRIWNAFKNALIHHLVMSFITNFNTSTNNPIITSTELEIRISSTSSCRRISLQTFPVYDWYYKLINLRHKISSICKNSSVKCLKLTFPGLIVRRPISDFAVPLICAISTSASFSALIFASFASNASATVYKICFRSSDDRPCKNDKNQVTQPPCFCFCFCF